MNLVKKIYLIGHINPSHPETYVWREQVEDYFGPWPTVEIINPCDSSFDAKLMDDGLEDPGRLKAYRKKGTRIFVPKSFQSVDESTIAIANLCAYGSEDPMIGALFELAWYMTHPHKTVIGLLPEGNISTDPHAAHPFVARLFMCGLNQ